MELGNLVDDLSISGWTLYHALTRQVSGPEWNGMVGKGIVCHHRDCQN